MSVNDHRKCSKCRKTRAQDPMVTFHRFPNPGKNNIRKAYAWAKYCWPSENWSSQDILLSLHKSNKVLCGRHFSLSQFYDNMKQKLSKFAIPDIIEAEVETLRSSSQVQGGQSNVRENMLHRQPLMSIENITFEPSTSVLQLKTKMNIENERKSELSKNDQWLSSQVQQEQLSMKENMLQRKPVMQIDNITVEPSTSKLQCTNKVNIDTERNLSKNEKQVPAESGPATCEIATGVQKKFKKPFTILKTINTSKLKELTEREIKLYNICRNKIREIIKLRKKLFNKKKANIIKNVADDDSVKELCNLNLSNSFILLLQSQLKNCPKKPKGRRFTLHQKIMALTIYKKSPACYRLLKRMFALPCQSTLNKLLHKVPLKVGINQHIFNSLKEMVDKNTDEENLCTLLFDEMSIRKHLQYDLTGDEIQGFQDHGTHGKTNDVATKVLVFMLAGVRKKWKQPIAFYFSYSLTADRMTMILKEILTECFNINLNVVSTVCDLSTVNLRVLRTLGATSKEPYFTYNGREIITVLDPPHLLKCTRNLLLKYDIECTTNIQSNNTSVKGKVKWSHIKLFYTMDKGNMNFVYAPALTDSHISPNVQQQMRVKYAAQVFSHSVAAGILAKIASNELPSEAHATAMFIEKIDQLFDAVNADSPDLRRGKKYSTNLTRKSCHLTLFAEMKKFISTMKYLGSKSKPPSQEGWIHTINAIERLWKKFQEINIKTLSTRRLNQDPLENFFGCIRYNCGSNNNPTTQQFIGGVKTAIISNLKHTSQKKNCENDSSILYNNLESFLTAKRHEMLVDGDNSYWDIEKDLSDAVKAVQNVTPESQACGYVSGFIFKKLKHKACKHCQKAFLTVDKESIHTFTSFKEYSDNESLNYVNKNVILCIETIATIINHYLKLNAHLKNLKFRIMTALKEVDFSFLNTCVTHKVINMEHIQLCTFFICVKRYNILKNRELEEEEKLKSFQRKMNKLKNK